MTQRLVVAGNGLVGQRLVEALRERDVAGDWQVTVLGEEPRRAYDRVALSSYFDGVGAEELDLVARRLLRRAWRARCTSTRR